MFLYGFFSRNSLASFTFVARYGLPPLSGWLSSMSDLCRLRIISFVRPRSLLSESVCLSCAPPPGWTDCGNIRCLENERCFSSCHLRFEATLVERLAKCVGSLSISPERDESCAALVSGQPCGGKSCMGIVRRMRRPRCRSLLVSRRP